MIMNVYQSLCSIYVVFVVQCGHCGVIGMALQVEHAWSVKCCLSCFSWNV